MDTSAHQLFHALRVREVRPDADDAAIVCFDVPAELAAHFAYRPGQFLTVRATVSGEELRRSYSICDWGEPGVLRIGVRHVPGGAFTTWLHGSLKPGDTLDVMAPDGKFVVPAVPVERGSSEPLPSRDDPSDRPRTPLSSVPTQESRGGSVDPRATRENRHYLAIAGGSGITPIMALLKATLADDPACRWTLLYGNRTLRSTMFKEELEDLKDRYLARLELHFVFSREHTDAPLNTGHLSREKLAEFFATVVDPRAIAHAFVCGPYAMNDEAEAALLAAGLSEEQIHIERFGVPDAGAPQVHAPQAGDAAEATIVIVRDGLTREVAFHSDAPSILEAARRAGLEMPFSCTSGVCATCRAKLLEGEVRMDRNFALEKKDLAAGFVLTCQSHPLTERVVLSWDER
jgi:ring-1,2-phenylacetyl-CoA epoxidase subunit PaaE